MKTKLLTFALILGLIGLISFVSASYASISPTPTKLISEDSDKDGYSNLCEELHKTNPNDANSKPTSNITINIPSDVKTIQEAINVAIDGDTIAIAQGKYQGNINFKGRTITLTSTDPQSSDVVANTIIEGTEKGSVVTIDNSNSALKGFTITSGNIDCRGIYVKDASPTIENCTIIDNQTTESGGGIYISTTSSRPKITNCIITGNSDSSGTGESPQISGGGTPEISYSLIGPGLVNTTETLNTADEEPTQELTTLSSEISTTYSEPTTLEMTEPKEIHVYPGAGTIAAVINDPTTVDGDIIVLHPGVYRGKGTWFQESSSSTKWEWEWTDVLTVKGKNLTFRSEYPDDKNCVENTIIYGAYPSSNGGGYGEMPPSDFYDKLFPLYIYYSGPSCKFQKDFSSGKTSNCRLEGLTIISGFREGDPGLQLFCLNDVHPGYGALVPGYAGIKCTYNSTLTISKCRIIGGGADPQVPQLHSHLNKGIYCESQNNLIIEHSTISENDGMGVNVDVPSGGGEITITECTISENGTTGVEAYSNGGEITITNCTIKNNNSNREEGGGVHIRKGNALIEDCNLTGNIAGHGGAICMGSGGTAVSGIIRNCTISGNEVYYSGGGIYLNTTENITIDSCLISGNTAQTESGGGICDYMTPVLTVTNCTIRGNHALGDYGNGGGGGIHSENGNMNLINCMITGNETDRDGGGILSYGGTSSNPSALINSTVAGNSAGGLGGGAYFDTIHLGYGTSDYYIDLTNSIFWGNEAYGEVPASEIAGRDYDQIYGHSKVNISHCDIQNSKSVTCSNVSYLVDGDSPNNCSYLYYYLLGKDCGGNILPPDNQNFPFIAEGDYHLSEDSPCIDTGLNSVVDSIEGWDLDIDGDTRILNEFVDIGADEYNPQDEVSPQLVAYYKFDGNLIDSSGNNYNGNPVGNVNYGTGVSGQATNYDGSGDGVSMGNVLNFGTTDFTVSFWFNPTWTKNERIFMKRGGTCGCAGGGFWEFGIDTAKKITFYTTSDNCINYADATSASTYNANTWYYVTGVRQGNKTSLYVNGNLEATKEIAGIANVDNTGNLMIGDSNCHDGTNYRGADFSGKFDEVKIWNSALTPSQILNEKNSYDGLE